MVTVSALVFVLLFHVTRTFLLPDIVDQSEKVEGGVVNIFSSPRETVVRDDLKCFDECKRFAEEDTYYNNAHNYDECCACNSNATWAGQEVNLGVENLTVLGKSIVVPQHAVEKDTKYKIELRNGRLGDIPSNICDWDNAGELAMMFTESFHNLKDFWNAIVKMDFKGNKICKLVNLTCLSHLDTLQLGDNRITYLQNNSFHTLTHLRVLNLENNWISAMDPSVMTSPKLHLTSINLRNNRIGKLDITNCMSLYPFCDIDFSHNSITEITNVNNFKLDMSLTYGPGYVNLQNNDLTTFPDLKNILHLDSIPQLGQLLKFGFDIRNVPIVCDGRIEPYLELAPPGNLYFWRYFRALRCNKPPAMFHRKIGEIGLDEYVTDHTCYQQCKCQDRPSQHVLYVDCSGLGISDMSKGELPDRECCQNIHLNLSNNDIKIVEKVVNLDKVRVLDISNNDVVGISPDVTFQLDNLTLLNLANNSNLVVIPEQFRYLNSCKVHIDSQLTCDCDSAWITEWSKKSSCDGNVKPLQCYVPGQGLMPVEQFNEDLLECDHSKNFYTKAAVTLGILTSFIIFISGITHQLRYEILITLLRIRRTKKNEVVPSFSYDAYFSFDEENDGLRTWVNSELIPQLEERGYKNVLSYRDMDFGVVRDNMTIDVLNKTRNFVLILSQSYFEQEGLSLTEREWKHGWNMLLSNKFKNIVIVNYDHMSSFDVDHLQIKAFLRVGGPVNFTNQSRDIIEQIARKLGPPLVNDTFTNKSFVSKKAMFDVNDLFLVDDPNVIAAHSTEMSKDYEEISHIQILPNMLESNLVKDQSKPVFRFQRYS